MDPDRQRDPDVCTRLWHQMLKGIDLTVASRHIPGGGVSDWHFSRRALSRGAQFLAWLVLPTIVGRARDPMSGFFMVRRACIENVKLEPCGYKILIEGLARGYIRLISEIPYMFRERIDGRSKATWRIYAEGAKHLVHLRISAHSVLNDGPAIGRGKFSLRVRSR
jgi:dolichol-phosphate mannosyltransferase